MNNRTRIWLISLIIAVLAAIAWLVTPITTSTASVAPSAPQSEIATSTVASTTPKTAPKQQPKPSAYGWSFPSGLDAKTAEILADLISCESGGKQTALNKVDRDGTPSYGLLQFKTGTLAGAIRQYGLIPHWDGDIMAVIYHGDLQIAAFLAMYGDGQPISWWKQQFPDCSKKYGYWL